MSGAGWAAITPARNEAENLPRLAASLAAQRTPPREWIIVDNGSTDATPEVAGALAAEHAWIRVLELPASEAPRRGAASMRAFNAGLAALAIVPRAVANIDADVSLPPDYLAQLDDAFTADPRLGIAGGSCFELEDGRWRQRHVTGATVWGAARAYRWACLQEILPLEERMSGDSLAQLRANARGWGTRTLMDLPFHHHRPEGTRDGSAARARRNEGRAAHYMWYRSWYLALRAGLHMARGDLGAPALLLGYGAAALRGEPRSPDPLIRRHVRSTQSPMRLPRRVAEALRRRRRQEPSGQADLLLVCSSGGHLLQLVALREAWVDFSRAWVTFDKSDARSLLRGERVVFAHGPTNRNVPNLVRNLGLAVRVVRRMRPNVIVTTGAGVAVPFAWVGRLLGARVVYIESFTRIDDASLSCRMIAPAADRLYVQWPQLAEILPGSRHVGNVFGSR
jgi:beta-1,4-N-acetylglucosaminyltransferase